MSRRQSTRKLTDAQVLQILTTPGVKQSEWAKRAAVTRTTIARVVHGHFYKNVFDVVKTRIDRPCRVRKLTDAQVLEILGTPEISQSEWAARLSVSSNVVWRVRHGLAYKHVFRAFQVGDARQNNTSQCDSAGGRADRAARA